MPRYHYTATDAQGQPLSGEVEATTQTVAHEELLRQGLIVHAIRAVSEGRSLSAADAATITQQVSLATQNALPLVGSLRAFSEEVSSSRLRNRILRVCTALEAGEPLKKVLADPELRLPASVAAIMESGMPSEAMNHLLSLSVRTASMAADLRARAFLMVTYPLLMILAIVTFWVFLLTVVTPQFGEIFSDFGVEVSPFLVQLLELSRILRSGNAFYVIAVIPIVALICWGYWFWLEPKDRRRIWCGIPIIGAMYRLAALSELAKLLALLLEARVPLPQALSWSGAGTGDADLQDCCTRIAARLRLGEDVVTASQHVSGVPAHLEQMARFAACGPTGGPPLRSMAQLLEIRAKSLSQAAMPLMEPVLLMGAVISVLGFVLTVFPPLIKLLNDLS